MSKIIGQRPEGEGRKVIQSKYHDDVWYLAPNTSDLKAAGIFRQQGQGRKSKGPQKDAEGVKEVTTLLNRLQCNADGSKIDHTYTQAEVGEWDSHTFLLTKDDLDELIVPAVLQKKAEKKARRLN